MNQYLALALMCVLVAAMFWLWRYVQPTVKIWGAFLPRIRGGWNDLDREQKKAVIYGRAYSRLQRKYPFMSPSALRFNARKMLDIRVSELRKAGTLA